MFLPWGPWEALTLFFDERNSVYWHALEKSFQNEIEVTKCLLMFVLQFFLVNHSFRTWATHKSDSKNQVVDLWQASAKPWKSWASPDRPSSIQHVPLCVRSWGNTRAPETTGCFANLPAKACASAEQVPLPTATANPTDKWDLYKQLNPIE